MRHRDVTTYIHVNTKVHYHSVQLFKGYFKDLGKLLCLNCK